MTKEYITKNRAKQFVCGHCNEVCSEEPCEPSDCDWIAFIDKEPAADVVEVVRCIDCRYCISATADNAEYELCIVDNDVFPVSVQKQHFVVAAKGRRKREKNNVSMRRLRQNRRVAHNLANGRVSLPVMRVL